jgi:23S rRNA G2445 N2-methylase RlmL
MQKSVSIRITPFRGLNLIQTARHVATHATTGEYFATCHPGLEEIVAFELSAPAIGADNIRIGKAGVSFNGDVDVIYKSNLWLRSAIRVLSLLTELDLNPDLPAGESIYEAFSAAASWTDLLKRGQTFSVDARIYGNSNFTNSQLLSTRARDAICDYVRDRTGTRPLPPERGRTPDLPLFVTAFQDQIRIYRDCSGESLHRRGYRQVMHAAPLNEAAAAGCLYLAGWDKKAQQAQQGGGAGDRLVLADPMCGSGTFLIEAALMATNTAPGLFRRWWPFLGWPDADLDAWRNAVDSAKESARSGAAAAASTSVGLTIYGNDWYSKALDLSLRDIRASGMEKYIKLHHGNCKSWELPQTPSIVITNPPWGKRLMSVQRGAKERQERDGGRDREREGRGGYADRRQGRDSYGGGRRGGNNQYTRDFAYETTNVYRNGEGQGGAAMDQEEQELADAWSGLGTFLKRQAGGADAFILSGSSTATQHLRLRADKRMPVTIGGVDCRLLQYHIRGLNPDSPSLSGPSSQDKIFKGEMDSLLG